MISAQAVARSKENQAQQALAVMGRTAINYITKGAYGAMRSVDKIAKEVDEPKMI